MIMMKETALDNKFYLIYREVFFFQILFENVLLLLIK